MTFQVLGLDPSAMSAEALERLGMDVRALDCVDCGRRANSIIDSRCPRCFDRHTVERRPAWNRVLGSSRGSTKTKRAQTKRPHADPRQHGGEMAAAHAGDPWAFGGTLDDVALEWGDGRVMRSRPSPCDGFSVSPEPGRGLIVLADDLKYDESGYRDLVLLHEIGHVLGWKDEADAEAFAEGFQFVALLMANTRRPS